MKNRQFFLQMSGVPGSGKSTVARAVSSMTGGIVIDHDVTKSALLEAGVPVELAGKASYSVLQAVARHLLAQRKSVIFDSPCFYTELLGNGIALAERFGAVYLYIECVLNDLDELDRRLRSRRSRISQLSGVRKRPAAGSEKALADEQVFLEWMKDMKQPGGDYLVLDTSASVEDITQNAIAYVISRIKMPLLD